MNVSIDLSTAFVTEHGFHTGYAHSARTVREFFDFVGGIYRIEYVARMPAEGESGRKHFRDKLLE